MLIEKSKFLLLVAAISSASAACIIVDDNDDDGIGGENEGAGNEGGGTTKSSTSTGNDGGGGGSGDCLADDGTSAACDSTCEGFTNCSGVENLKEGVEENLVDCMNALDPVSCSFETDVLNTCLVNTSAYPTCADPLSEQICNDAATACGADQDWTEQCFLYSDMLNVTGQAAWSICLETDCNEGATPDVALSGCVLDTFFPIN